MSLDSRDNNGREYRSSLKSISVHDQKCWIKTPSLRRCNTASKKFLRYPARTLQETWRPFMGRQKRPPYRKCFSKVETIPVAVSATKWINTSFDILKRPDQRCKKYGDGHDNEIQRASKTHVVTKTVTTWPVNHQICLIPHRSRKPTPRYLPTGPRQTRFSSRPAKTPGICSTPRKR